MPNVFIKTFGCQMNVYDSGRMRDILLQNGYEQTDDVQKANIIIINTCHIREKASDRIFSELGLYAPLKKENPNLIIVVAGCVVQAEGAEFLRKAKLADIALGPVSYHLLPQKIAEVKKARENGLKNESRLISAEFKGSEKFDCLPDFFGKQTPCAYLAIQEGCNRFCSYCVVPYTRGPEFSRGSSEILSEAKKIIKNGAKDITLLGQNVNAWHGKDERGTERSLGWLLRKVAELDGLERLRFVTSYPSDMDDDLISVFGENEKIMSYLHLPVQSGSNKVLKAMNRRYTREEYLNIIDKVKAIRPDIAISSDFIVGFATETNEDFQETLDLVDTVKFASSFSFKYSPRAGTVGATLSGQVPEDVKGERLTILQAKLQKYQEQFNSLLADKTVKVLFEGPAKQTGEYVGHTPYMQTVTAKSNEDLTGKLLNVHITETGLNGLKGEIQK